jgi:hypothetical protein
LTFDKCYYRNQTVSNCHQQKGSENERMREIAHIKKEECTHITSMQTNYKIENLIKLPKMREKLKQKRHSLKITRRTITTA